MGAVGQGWPWKAQWAACPPGPPRWEQGFPWEADPGRGLLSSLTCWQRCQEAPPFSRVDTVWQVCARPLGFWCFLLYPAGDPHAGALCTAFLDISTAPWREDGGGGQLRAPSSVPAQFGSGRPEAKVPRCPLRTAPGRTWRGIVHAQTWETCMFPWPRSVSSRQDPEAQHPGRRGHGTTGLACTALGRGLVMCPGKFPILIRRLSDPS